MNIFFLSQDPMRAAQYLCDVHLNKMIIESGQILSTVYREWLSPAETGHVDLSALYKPTHKNHPSVKWCGESQAMRIWVYKWMLAMDAERKHRAVRLGKNYKSHATVVKLCNTLNELDCRLYSGSLPHIVIPQEYQAVPPEFKSYGGIRAYQKYYATTKVMQPWATWKGGDFPYALGLCVTDKEAVKWWHKTWDANGKHHLIDQHLALLPMQGERHA